MKRTFLIGFMLYAGLLFSQNQNSLLWKISGNGLEKDSYLFGTMHVSERIAFHLDDVFYESLIKSDYVALESNPEKWLDHSFESGELSGNFNVTSSGRNFYNKAFQFQAPKLREMSMFLSREHYLLNGILYRTNPMMQDFQEETYLDMFIFQSGSKYGKEVVGLEDIEKSSELVKKATKGRFRKDSPDLWLQKLMKEKNFTSLMSDSYRDRNIFFLDSLNKAIYNEKYMENMLYIRNEDMARGIDSLAQLGSTFSAVGAAHLAGEKGVIQKLKDRGYTVTPLLSEKTDKGKEMKDQIEVKEAKVVYEERLSSDGFFSVNSTSKLYELGAKEFTIYLSPNIRNGAYHTVVRINRMTDFGGEIESLEGIDRILFENIPGSIISKKEITKGGFKGLDIVNKTKIGDYQRYQIFMTPLEVVIFKMAGKRDYVLTRGDQFFDSVQFLKVSGDWVTVSPKFKGFEISMPKSHSFNNYDKRGNRFLQSYDGEGNYYFLKEVVLNDMDYIEEDDFELKRIHNRFYKNMKLEFDEGAFVGSGTDRHYVSKSKKSESEKYTHIKTVIKGGYYYLIGKIGKDSNLPKTYFDSFKLTSFKYKPEDFEVRKDTGLLYSVNTLVKPSYGYSNRSNKDKKDYESYTKKSSYYSDANEEIEVNLKKFHDWKYFENIDSLWKSETEKYRKFDFKLTNLDLDNYVALESRLKTQKFYVDQKEKGKDAFGNETLNYYLRDSLSDRAVKVKQVYTNGKLFTLKTLVDTRYKESEFVEKFYATFQPDESEKEEIDLFKSKVDLFVEGLKKGDSVLVKAKREVKFGKEHEQLLIDLFRDETIKVNQEMTRAYLLYQLSKIDSKRVDQFLEEVYGASFNNPINQLTVFNSVAKKKNKDAFKKLLKLLETDVPITNNDYDIQSMFRSMKDTLELSKDLYPKLLTYTAIDTYKKPVYELLVDLLEKGLVKPKVYRKYVDQIRTEARIEIKKQLSTRLENENDDVSIISYRNNYLKKDDESNLLKLYIKLLTPYLDQKGMKELLDKITLINDLDVKTTYVIEMTKAKRSVDSKVIEELLKSYDGHYNLFKKLQKINRLDILPQKYREKDTVYKAMVLRLEDLTEKDSISFVKKKEFSSEGKDFEVHFFKVKKKPEYEYAVAKWKLYYSIFKKEKGKIQTRSAHFARGKEIDETEPLEDQLDIYIEKYKLRNRKRVSLSVKGNGLYGFY